MKYVLSLYRNILKSAQEFPSIKRNKVSIIERLKRKREKSEILTIIYSRLLKKFGNHSVTTKTKRTPEKSMKRLK